MRIDTTTKLSKRIGNHDDGVRARWIYDNAYKARRRRAAQVRQHYQSSEAQRNDNAIKAKRTRYDNAVKAMCRETTTLSKRGACLRRKYDNAVKASRRYTTTLFIIERNAQHMIRRHCQSSEAQRYENAIKAWREQRCNDDA